MKLLHILGFHDYQPTPQTLADFLWGFRTWKCSGCGKEQIRREYDHPDNSSDVWNREWDEALKRTERSKQS